MGTIMEILPEYSYLVNLGGKKKYGTLYMNTQVCVIVPGDIKSQ